MIKRSSIENLKRQVDIYQVISDYVTLKRSGSSWIGLSPFSQEKTPSFHVNPDKGLYHCFSTSQGGDAITFLMVKENLTFSEAAEMLAERFHVKLEFETRDGKPREQDTGGRRAQVELQEAAMVFFRNAFESQDEKASAVRDYWTLNRGFTLEQAKQWDIGFAPVSGDGLVNHLRKLGIHDTLLEKSGLFYASSDAYRSDQPLCRFRGRLMIPIRDLNGKVVAFTARKLDGITPQNDVAFNAKYVNSPGTDLFHKGNLLFGLYHAKRHVSAENPFLLVEGQLDTLRCWSVGIDQAIAPQGTAISAEQLGKLRQYCPKVICFLDGDEAGIRAALRMIPIALSVGLEVAFLTVPEGKDPDEFLRTHGKSGFDSIVRYARDCISYLADRIINPARESPESLSRAFTECFEIITHSPSESTQYAMLEQLTLLSPFRQAMREDLHKFKRHIRERRRTTPNAEEASRNPESGTPVSTFNPGSLESGLFFLLMRHPELRSRPELHRIDPKAIHADTIEGILLSRVLAEIAEDPSWIPELHSETVVDTDAERAIFFRTLAEERNIEDPLPSFRECISRFEDRRDRMEIAFIDSRIAERNYEGDNDLLEMITFKTRLQRSIAQRASGSQKISE